jgi:hypothetical protein
MTPLDVTHQVTLHITTLYGTLIPLDSTGVLDWITGKNKQAQTAVRALAITVAIIFVMYQAVASRLAMARVIVSGLVAGIFVWIVFNVTALQARVNNEVNNSGAPISTTYHPDAPAQPR